MSSACGSLLPRMPFWLSSKTQFFTSSRPRSKRMPAPLPSPTRAPANSMSWIVAVPRTTKIALSSADAPSAISRTRPPPAARMVRSFCVHTATSRR